MEKKEIQKLPAGITQDMVNAAKAKWPKTGAVITAELERDDSDEILEVLIRRPDRSVMSEYSKWSDKSPKKADDILVKNCLLSHKDEVTAEDAEDLFMGAIDAISQTIVVRKAKIKNI
ncbi:hypothetical protein [Pedobacter sp. WC2423]|uniref:hypothetical protein n=1 Tax=Pedobacter sp. WC2423 TaxID=3234142 RepID=UPI0034654B01